MADANLLLECPDAPVWTQAELDATGRELAIGCTFQGFLEPAHGDERTQHRRRWRGKRISVRRRIPDDLAGRMMAPLIAYAIRMLWRAGRW